MTSLEIQAFLAIHQAGSISRAAEQLYISQSSLSSRLHTLERELGCKLFVRGRGSRALALSLEGERFLPMAGQYQELEKKMRSIAISECAESVLRISSINSVGSYLLPPVYERFSRQCSDVRLEILDINTSEAQRSITKGNLDLAFSTLSCSTEHIATIPFASEPMAFMCAAGSEYSDPVLLSELSAEREVFSVWSEELSQWHNAVFGADAQPQVRLELMSQMRLFISHPGAWAIVPESIASVLHDAPDLRRCDMGFDIPDRTLYILCRRDARDSQPVQRFLDCLREVLAEQKFPGLLL